MIVELAQHRDAVIDLCHRFGVSSLFVVDLLGRPVDLTSPAAVVNPFLAESIARTQSQLYAA